MYVPDNSDRYIEHEREIDRLERLFKKHEYIEDFDVEEMPFYEEEEERC